MTRDYHVFGGEETLNAALERTCGQGDPRRREIGDYTFADHYSESELKTLIRSGGFSWAASVLDVPLRLVAGTSSFGEEEILQRLGSLPKPLTQTVCLLMCEGPKIVAPGGKLPIKKVFHHPAEECFLLAKAVTGRDDFLSFQRLFRAIACFRGGSEEVLFYRTGPESEPPLAEHLLATSPLVFSENPVRYSRVLAAFSDDLFT